MGGIETQFHSCLTSAIDGGKRSTSRALRFILGETKPATDCAVGWLGLTVGLDVLAKTENSRLYPDSNQDSTVLEHPIFDSSP